MFHTHIRTALGLFRLCTLLQLRDPRRCAQVQVPPSTVSHDARNSSRVAISALRNFSVYRSAQMTTTLLASTVAVQFAAAARYRLARRMLTPAI
ncbi:hypothetical protein C8Q80DRAFT_514459 [Daedaleopsis nitida]|nr:hypothetical protein C8Q80DRAFT_514459 [Daedaleopsis nitida]